MGNALPSAALPFGLPGIPAAAARILATRALPWYRLAEAGLNPAEVRFRVERAIAAHMGPLRSAPGPIARAYRGCASLKCPPVPLAMAVSGPAGRKHARAWRQSLLAIAQDIQYGYFESVLEDEGYSADEVAAAIDNVAGPAARRLAADLDADIADLLAATAIRGDIAAAVSRQVARLLRALRGAFAVVLAQLSVRLRGFSFPLALEATSAYPLNTPIRGPNL